MCEALRELMKEEIEKEKDIAIREGHAKGRAEGRAEGREEIAKNLIRNGVDISIIADSTGLSKEEINSLK